jgi:hypothetical protein
MAADLCAIRIEGCSIHGVVKHNADSSMGVVDVDGPATGRQESQPHPALMRFVEMAGSPRCGTQDKWELLLLTGATCLSRQHIAYTPGK